MHYLRHVTALTLTVCQAAEKIDKACHSKRIVSACDFQSWMVAGLQTLQLCVSLSLNMHLHVCRRKKVLL